MNATKMFQVMMIFLMGVTVSSYRACDLSVAQVSDPFFVFSPLFSHFYVQFQVDLLVQKLLNRFSGADAQLFYGFAPFSDKHPFLCASVHNNICMDPVQFGAC